jgi:quercetin dioxygenase-like cupin family protein
MDAPEGTYHVFETDSLEPTPEYPCTRRSISEAADLSMLAAATYTLDPGQQLPRTYHSHDQREELFYVLSGELSVETPDRAYTVPTGSVFVAKPASPHRAYNPESAGDPVSVLGVGAPQFDPAKPYDPASDDA